MSGGAKRMVINTQERATSTDINRLQSFAHRAEAEVRRYLCDVSYGTDDLDAAAVAAETSVATAPATGDVYGGLMVQPQSGSLDLAVTKGSCEIIAPDGGVDDSNFKLAIDPGLAAGGIAMTANPGVSPRIDVIECQWVEVTTETDNRDIFDTTANLFVAATVTKAREGRLTYRVRPGTVGGGFASVGTALGWMPIAVACVPAGAVNNDTITFWDVRPIVQDREFAPYKISRSVPKHHRGVGRVVLAAGPAQTQLSGLFEVSAFGRRLGGRVRPGVPIADADLIDIAAAANQTTGQVPGNNVFYAVYLLAPFGLPRWARYTDGPAGRVPRSPRGILVVSSILPNKDGTPSSALNLPAITGLGGNTSTAVCILVGVTDGGGTMAGVSASGGMQHSQIGKQINGTALAAGTATFTLIENTNVPANARALHCTFNVTDGTVATGNVGEIVSVQVKIKSAAGDTVSYVEVNPHPEFPNSSGGNITAKWGFDIRIPLDSEYPTNAPGTRVIELVWGNVSVTGAPGAAVMRVTGWELGS